MGGCQDPFGNSVSWCLTADLVVLFVSDDEVEPESAVAGLDPTTVAVAGALADGGCGGGRKGLPRFGLAVRSRRTRMLQTAPTFSDITTQCIDFFFYYFVNPSRTSMPQDNDLATLFPFIHT